MEFKDRLNNYIREIDGYLKVFFPREEDIPRDIIEAMEYSIFAG